MKRQQRVANKNTANSWVSKMGARSFWKLLTGNYLTTQQFFTELLTISSAEEQMLKTIAARTRLKHTTAAIWECVRYGWTQAAFGRKPNPTIANPCITCRRTRKLIIRALDCGARIAHNQANGPAA